MYSRKRKLDTKPVNHDASSASRSQNREETTERRECPNQKGLLVDGFSRLKAEGKIFDFVIIFEGTGISVHRAVLCISSKYFEAMLTNNTVEKNNGCVAIEGVTLKAGKQCIEFMYTGGVSFSLKNPVDLIHAAELMGLPNLTDMYFEYVKENLGAKDCLKYLQLAETFSHRSFAEFFKKLSVRNFEDLLACKELPDMSLSLMGDFLAAGSGDGHVSEVAKWKAVITWAHADIETRQKAFLILFGTLELKYFTESFLRETVLTHPLVKDSLKAKVMVLNAILDPTKPRPDGGAFNRGTSYVICCHSETRMLHKYDPTSDRMERYARIPPDVYKKPVEIVGVEGEVYVTSGDTVSKFRDGKLVHLLNTERQAEHHQCISYGNNIYLVFKERTYKYSARTNYWSKFSAGVELGVGFFITGSENFIYAMGGVGTERVAKEFDFVTKTWEPIPRMQLGRKYGAAVCNDSKVYALGGRADDANNQIEFYTPNNNIWSYTSTGIRCSHYRFKAFNIFTPPPGKIQSNRMDAGEVLIVGGIHGVHSGLNQNQCLLRKPAPCLAKLNFSSSKYTPLTPFLTYGGPACIVYYN